MLTRAGQLLCRGHALLWGRDADEAVTNGHAGRLADGRVAFSQIEVGLRHEALVSRSWHSYSDLAASSESAISTRMDLIQQPRAPIAGLTFDAPLIMGIVNVTPDSFSDGGEVFDRDDAVARGRNLAAAGAQMLDVGGESTRPGSDPVPVEAELDRVLPVIRTLADDGHLISIDTRKPEVMRAAAETGARIVNDVSALTFDAASRDWLVEKLDGQIELLKKRSFPEQSKALEFFEARAAFFAILSP